MYSEVSHAIDEISVHSHSHSRLRPQNRRYFISSPIARGNRNRQTVTDRQLQTDTDAYAAHGIEGMPAIPTRLQEIRQAQEQDSICQQLMLFHREGWPHHSKLKGNIKLYKPVADELSVQSGLLLRGSHLVIPTALRKETLVKIHTGHLGITKCQKRAKQSVWWPKIGKYTEEEVQKCLVCSQFVNRM